MASARGVLQRISSLSRSNGSLSVDLMRRVVVAAVTSVAMYGAEISWRGQKDRVHKVQLTYLMAYGRTPLSSAANFG